MLKKSLFILLFSIAAISSAFARYVVVYTSEGNPSGCPEVPFGSTSAVPTRSYAVRTSQVLEPFTSPTAPNFTTTTKGGPGGPVIIDIGGDEPIIDAPIGDAIWPLLLMAAAAMGCVYLRRKRTTKITNN